MMDGLFQEIHRLCAEGVARGSEGAPYLPAVARAIERRAARKAVAPRGLPPVERHLDQALSLAERGPHAELAAALRTCAHLLAWHDCVAPYGALPEMAGFVANFAYTALLGPDSYGLGTSHACDEVFFGVSLQGPHTLYPAHGHRAVELYAVIAGEAAWQRGAESWRRRPPGSLILHEPDLVHAMETFDEPLLTFFAWVSDLDCQLWVGPAAP